MIFCDQLTQITHEVIILMKLLLVGSHYLIEVIGLYTYVLSLRFFYQPFWCLISFNKAE
jgi:hypothetical protein